MRGDGAGAALSLSLSLRRSRPYRRRPKTLPLWYARLQPQEAGDNAQLALTTPSTDSLEGGIYICFSDSAAHVILTGSGLGDEAGFPHRG